MANPIEKQTATTGAVITLADDWSFTAAQQLASNRIRVTPSGGNLRFTTNATDPATGAAGIGHIMQDGQSYEINMDANSPLAFRCIGVSASVTVTIELVIN